MPGFSIAEKGKAVCSIFFVFFAIFPSTALSAQYCTRNEAYGYPLDRNLPICTVPLEQLVRDGPSLPGIPKNSAYLIKNQFPEWFNPELAARGQAFAKKNSAAIYYAAFATFLFFIADTDIRRILVDTGKSQSPEDSARRYLTNFLHMELWFEQDIRYNSTDIFSSLDNVRFRHDAALLRSRTREDILSKPLIPEPSAGENPSKVDTRIWKAFQQDLEASRFGTRQRQRQTSRYNPIQGHKLKFNQYVLAATYVLHMGLPVLIPEKIMIFDATEEELMGYLHLWAFFGKAIGVQDEYNLCLQPDLASARAYLRTFIDDHLVPTLFDLSYESKVMFEALFKGLNNAFGKMQNERISELPNLGPFFLLRLLEDGLGIPCPSMRGALRSGEKLVTSSFQLINRPQAFKPLRSPTNALFKFLFRTWSQIKFGIDTSNTTAVAENAFV
jgi:hypothetical protein